MRVRGMPPSNQEMEGRIPLPHDRAVPWHDRGAVPHAATANSCRFHSCRSEASISSIHSSVFPDSDAFLLGSFQPGLSLWRLTVSLV